MAKKGIGLTAPPPQPKDRMNRADRREYNQLQKQQASGGRVNAEDRRFMNQFQNTYRAPQPPQQQWQPQRPQMAPPTQGQQPPPMPIDRMNPGQMAPSQWNPGYQPIGGQQNRPWSPGYQPIGGQQPGLPPQQNRPWNPGWGYDAYRNRPGMGRPVGLSMGNAGQDQMFYTGGSPFFDESQAGSRPVMGQQINWRYPQGGGSSNGGY